MLFSRQLSVLLPLVILSACTSSDALIAKAQKNADQTVAALSKATDADSMAAAGLMSGKNSEASLAFLARATAAEPDRPDLLWLQANRCAQLPPCDPLPVERRLRELDPSNGAAWWGALMRATAAQDAERLDSALAAIGHAERVETYWTTLIAHLSRAVVKTKTMSVADSELTVVGDLAALSIPPYHIVTTPCKGERLQEPQFTATCRGVAKALQNGDTYITEMIGVAIAKRVWPENSAEWKAAVEERRVYEYRSKFYSKLPLRMVTHPREYLTLCAQNRREQDLLAAQLIAAGYEPNPR